jgi:CTP synthase (UTP-ammonia lyase)
MRTDYSGPSRQIRIGIIGDFDPNYPSQIATNNALHHAARAISRSVDVAWLSTPSLEDECSDKILEQHDALWCAPGSPYHSMNGALRAIRFARERDWPFVATCGGFQHTLIEYARHVLGIQDAEHAETAPDAPHLVIGKLSCSLVGQAQAVKIMPGTLARRIYGTAETVEEFRCNYGVHPAYRDQIETGGLTIAGRDSQGEIRIVELSGHRFFMATLFLPQLSSRVDRPHRLIVAYLNAAIAFQRGNAD